jgi:hypothetical protein
MQILPGFPVDALGRQLGMLAKDAQLLATSCPLFRSRPRMGGNPKPKERDDQLTMFSRCHQSLSWRIGSATS